MHPLLATISFSVGRAFPSHPSWAAHTPSLSQHLVSFNLEHFCFSSWLFCLYLLSFTCHMHEQRILTLRSPHLIACIQQELIK